MASSSAATASVEPADSVLDPVARTSEVLFGLIMVLTFTCSLSVATAGRSDVREMLLGALGCNLAWGLIDSFFYLMTTAAERGRERLLIQRLQDETNQESARELFKSIIPELILGSLSPKSFEEIRSHILTHQAERRTWLIHRDDIRAALTIFALVFLSTFPVALPFLIITEPWPALRVSNLIALILLFGLGHSLGRYAGRRAWAWGFGLMFIGAALVSLTISLGG